MMPEAAQVAGLGENGEGVSRPDAWYGHQTATVWMIRQQDGRLFGDALAQLVQCQILFEHEPEHRHRGTVERYRYANRLLSNSIDLGQQGPLVDLAPDQIPGLGLELRFAQSGNRRGR